MAIQTELTDKNFYPMVEETEDGTELGWDSEQALSCTECGGPLERMSPGATFDNLIAENLVYSCRNKYCGGSSVAGAGSLGVLVTEDGQLVDTRAIKSSKSPESDFILHPEAGIVHKDHFEPTKWEPVVTDE